MDSSNRKLSVRTRNARNLVPALAVGAVATAALLSAVMVTHSESRSEGSVAAAPAGRDVSAAKVVKAPPLVATMGAAAACSNCGVVESVVAVEGHARGQRQTVGYLMHIRMDDGTRQVVEHRGAMAAGSRVLIERGVVRAMPAQI